MTEFFRLSIISLTHFSNSKIERTQFLNSVPRMIVKVQVGTYFLFCPAVCGISLPESSGKSLHVSRNALLVLKPRIPAQGTIAENPKGFFTWLSCFSILLLHLPFRSVYPFTGTGFAVLHFNPFGVSLLSKVSNKNLRNSRRRVTFNEQEKV